MCHLATWVIDRKLDENHGKLFKNWYFLLVFSCTIWLIILYQGVQSHEKAIRYRNNCIFCPFQRYSELPLTYTQTRHTYQISYPYKWGEPFLPSRNRSLIVIVTSLECQKCQKMWGRDTVTIPFHILSKIQIWSLQQIHSTWWVWQVFLELGKLRFLTRLVSLWSLPWGAAYSLVYYKEKNQDQVARYVTWHSVLEQIPINRQTYQGLCFSQLRQSRQILKLTLR